MIIRESIRAFGSVQGVGFRYRARYAAEGLGLTGWVRNEWDGSVSMEVQGDPEKIQEMLEQISKGTYVEITELERHELPVEADERGFHVR